MNISGKTQLIGLIGWPVSHSFSPAMHNAAAADLGLDFVYVALPVNPDDVETAVRGLPALGFRGFNITDSESRNALTVVLLNLNQICHAHPRVSDCFNFKHFVLF